MSENKPDLTETEKKALRSLRFSSGVDMTTSEAKSQMEIEKQKIEERKKRFGSTEPDIEEEKQKMLERQKRFGIPSEDEEKQKIEFRKKRFSTEDNEQIINARKERFKDQYDLNNKDKNKLNTIRGGRRIRKRRIIRTNNRKINNNMNRKNRRTRRPIGNKRLPMKRRIRKIARKN